MQPKNAVQFARYLFGLINYTGQILLGQNHTKKRISLLPARLIFERVVTLVQSADIGECRVVDHLTDITEVVIRRFRASRYPNRVLMFLPANAVSVTARIRDHEKQRLLSKFEPALQHFHD